MLNIKVITSKSSSSRLDMVKQYEPSHETASSRSEWIYDCSLMCVIYHPGWIFWSNIDWGASGVTSKIFPVIGTMTRPCTQPAPIFTIFSSCYYHIKISKIFFHLLKIANTFFFQIIYCIPMFFQAFSGESEILTSLFYHPPNSTNPMGSIFFPL